MNKTKMLEIITKNNYIGFKLASFLEEQGAISRFNPSTGDETWSLPNGSVIKTSKGRVV